LALDKEFVLKYKDTEGDLITITSNEELACALGYSDKNLLRLVAVPKDDSSISVSDNTSDSDSPVCTKRERGWGHYMYGGHGHFHGGHSGYHGNHGGYGFHRGHGGCHGWEQHRHGGHGECHGWEHMHGGHRHFQDGHGGCHGWEQRHGGHGWEQRHGGHGWGPEMFKARLTSKRDFIKSKLDELEKVTIKTPEQQQKVLRLQFKLKKIESHLERGCWENKGKGKHCGKWADKMEKRMSKREKKEKCFSQNLSEEAQTKIAMLRSQIDVLKPTMKDVKSQIRTKKETLKEAKAKGQDPKQLFVELSNLKEKRKALKNEISPLKEKIRELEYVSC